MGLRTTVRIVAHDKCMEKAYIQLTQKPLLRFLENVACELLWTGASLLQLSEDTRSVLQQLLNKVWNSL